jgi:uncharacterized repeat protein (TIGR02543 family)
MLILITVACAEPVVANNIEILLDGVKTEYEVGDEFNTEGMKFKISFSDSTNRTFTYEELKEDLEVSGFSTQKEINSLRVKISYKKQISTYFDISVSNLAGSRSNYTVKFETYADTKIEDIKASVNSTIDPPVEPEKDGYFFDGWYSDETLTNIWDFNTAIVKKNITLYAKWVKYLTVYFVPGYEIPEIVRNDVRPNVTYTNIPIVPARDGYTGVWNYSGEWDDLINSQRIDAIYTEVIYGVYFHFQNQLGETVNIPLNIDFHLGDDVSTIAKETIEKLEKPTPNYKVIVGYRLRGMAGEPFEKIEDVPGMKEIKSELHIEAVYATVQYDVTFDFGTNVNEELRYFKAEDIEYNQLITQEKKPDLETIFSETDVLENYIFKSWYLDNNIFQQEWHFDSDRVLRDNIVLYAKWVDVITITFYTNNKCDEIINSYPVEKGGNLPTPWPVPPSIEGRLTAWNVGEDAFVNIQEDLNIWAIDAPKYYRIVFQMQNGTIIQVNGNDDQMLEHGSSIKEYPTPPTLEYNTFSEWLCSTEGADFTNVTMDMNIIAIYERIYYNVVFIVNDKQEAQLTVQAGDPIPEAQRPSNPVTGEDQMFVAWHNQTNSEPWNMAEDIVVNDIELIAIFTPMYLVEFFDQPLAEGIVAFSSTRVRSGGYLVSSEIPNITSKTGYVGAWTIDNSKVDLRELSITGDIKVVMSYELEVYTIEFKFEGAKIDNFENEYQYNNVQYGSIINSPGEPQKEGYDFDSWDGYTQGMTAAGDKTFNARFVPWKFKVTFLIDNVNVEAETRIIGTVENANYGQAVAVPGSLENYESIGYRFVGWDRDIAKLTGAKGEEIIIKAKFEKINYTVEFYISTSVNEILIYITTVGHGDSISQETIKEINDKQSDKLVLEGHIFKGWNFTASALEPMTEEQINNKKVTEESRIFAIFTLKDIQIALKQQENILATETLKYGEILTNNKLNQLLNSYIEQNTSFMSGMAFMGWYKDETTSVKYIESPVIENLTLYGNWIEMTKGDDYVLYKIDELQGFAKVVGFTGDKKTTESIKVASHYNTPGETLSYEVMEISDNAFASMSALKNVELPITIKTIGTYAFNACTSLEKIIIPLGVTVIGANAFRECTALETIEFAERGVVSLSIGESAFQGTTKLKEIYVKNSDSKIYGIPEGTHTIERNAFNSAISLESIILPATLIEIGDNAFLSAGSLKYAKFNKLMPPRLGYNVFTDTELGFRIYVEILTNYENDSISNDGWSELKGRSKIYAFSNISFDGTWAYYEIAQGSNQYAAIIQYLGEGLEPVVAEVMVSESKFLRVATLESYVFNKKITKLTIPSDIEINEYSLLGTSSLKHLVFMIKDESYINRTYLKNLFDTNTLLTELSLTAKDNIRDVFGGMGLPVMLKTINILQNNDEDVILPEKMFENVISITKVTLPVNLVEIGAYAFAGCTNLQEVVFADYNASSAKLKTIGAYAFYNAVVLNANVNKSLIPGSVRSIGLYALDKTAYISGSFTDDLIEVGYGILYKYVGSSSSVTILNNITQINARAFYGNTSVVTVMSVRDQTTTTSNLAQIGEEAFSNMTNLENVILSTNLLKTIGTKAFAGSPRFNKLALITLTDGVSNLNIEEDAFQNTNEAFVIYVTKIASTSEIWQNKNIAITQNPGINSDNWLVDKNEANNGVNVIAYLKEKDETNSVVLTLTFRHPSDTQNYNPIEIGAFVLPQYIQEITVDVALPLNELAFDGLSQITKLTILNGGAAGGVAKGDLMETNTKVFAKLLKNNKGITKVDIPGRWSLKTLFNGQTPQHLTEVNILASGATGPGHEFSICEEMFKDAVYVKTITTVNELNEQTPIGKDAFLNSAWLNSFESSDGVASLQTTSNQKIAVAITEDNYYLKLDNEYIAVAQYAFYGNGIVELIELGSNIQYIGDRAFANMPRLIKVFIKRETEIMSGNISTMLEGNTKLQIFCYQKFIFGTSNYTVVLGDQCELKAIDGVIWSENGDLLYEANEATHTLLQIFREGSVEISTSYGQIQFTAYGANILLSQVYELSIKASQEFNARSFESTKNLERLVVLNVADSTRPQNFSTVLNNIVKQNPKLTVLAYDASVKLKELIGKNEQNEDLVLASHVTTLEILEGTEETVDFLLETAGKNISVVKMPQTLTKFGIGSFEGSNWYKLFPDFVILQDGILYKYKGTSTQLTVPASVKIIEKRAFSRLDYTSAGDVSWSSYIASIRFAINSNLIEIRSEAFYMAYSLMSMDLPLTIKIIAEDAFKECYFTTQSVTTQNNNSVIVRGPTSATYVKFVGGVNTVTIPKDIKFILPKAMKNLDYITKVTFSEGSLLLAIGAEAFSGCTSLESIVGLPDSLMYVGENAFYNIKGNITNIISESGSRLVYYAESQTNEIKIGNSASAFDNIRKISGGAFASLSQADIKIVVECADFVEIDKEAFESIQTVFVPDNLLSHYQQTWSENLDKIKPMSEYQ